MANEDWARIYNIDGKQILFYYEKNLDHSGYDIHQIVDHNGERVDILLRNVPPSQVEKSFDEIDETYARTAMNIIHGIVDDYDKRKTA